jgi:tRNA(adenine34) deaminase
MAKTKKTSTNKNKKRWVATVTTDSTHPEPGLFKKSASVIASALASRKVSPKGPASGMRMLNYFINRAGRGLSRERRTELERAKELLSKRIRQTTQAQDKTTTRNAA